MNWDQIRRFYRANQDKILKAGKDSWGVGMYSWDFEAGVQMTPIEFALWTDIRELSAVFYPQYPVGRRFVDFGNPCARVAIECDGAAFHADIAADRQRQAEIESYGWTVYRFTGRECFESEREYQDEFGNTRSFPSETLNQLRQIVAKHGLQLRDAGAGRILPASDFLVHLQARAA